MREEPGFGDGTRMHARKGAELHYRGLEVHYRPKAEPAGEGMGNVQLACREKSVCRVPTFSCVRRELGLVCLISASEGSCKYTTY
jgi:hypothetical protein